MKSEEAFALVGQVVVCLVVLPIVIRGTLAIVDLTSAVVKNSIDHIKNRKAKKVLEIEA